MVGPMTVEDFRALGERDEVAQAAWAEARDRELVALWVCADCGRKLPRGGLVWRSRWDDYRYANRLQAPPADSGWRCDACADAAERGIDY